MRIRVFMWIKRCGPIFCLVLKRFANVKLFMSNPPRLPHLRHMSGKVRRSAAHVNVL